jgi:adenylylsulfate kinase
MMLVQLTGLSGAGKTTLSYNVASELRKRGLRVEVIDGDEFRETLCKDLGFSRADRETNIARLAVVADRLVRNGVVVLLAAVNPYESARSKAAAVCEKSLTVWVDCDLETLAARDTKGLYRRASLPDGDPQKINNLTGVNDPYEPPRNPDLVLNTAAETETESTQKLLELILSDLETEDRVKRRALFIGRWQPFHNGHKWLIDQKLQKDIPVLIAVRDVEPDDQNPLTTAQVIEILSTMYSGSDVKMITIPNIESVNFGRGVGYEINEFSPPDGIGTISATEIRRELRAGIDAWKERIDPRLHELVAKYFA